MGLGIVSRLPGSSGTQKAHVYIVSLGMWWLGACPVAGLVLEVHAWRSDGSCRKLQSLNPEPEFLNPEP